MSQRRLPAGVYWRRRLLVLAAVIALVWVVLQLVGGGDDEPGAAQPTATPSATRTLESTVKTKGVVQVALTSATKPCDPEKIRITPSVRSGQFTKDPVDIGLLVSSSSKASCTLAPDDADLLAVITANGTPIWDSTVCKSSLLDEDVAISAGWSTLATVAWTGRGSGARCTKGEGWATPGKYTLQVGTLGGEPGRTSFSLAARPEAKAEPTPKKSRKTPDEKKPEATDEPSD